MKTAKEIETSIRNHPTLLTNVSNIVVCIAKLIPTLTYIRDRVKDIGEAIDDLLDLD